MGKHKKLKKGEEDDLPKPAGLRLILKVGGSSTPEQSDSPTAMNPIEDMVPSSPEAVEKHKKKKKEKKKKKDKNKERKEKKHKHKDKKREKDESSQEDESMVDEPVEVPGPVEIPVQTSPIPPPVAPPTRTITPVPVIPVPVMIPIPVPLSPTNRDRRSCVIKQIKEKTGLQKLLDLMLIELEKKDPKQFFAWPVTDAIAPGYSNVIKHPMDFSTIRSKIEEGKYSNMNQMLVDFELMCTNAMVYNLPETVYFKTSKKIHLAGLKLFHPERIRMFLPDVPHVLTAAELGFDPMYERTDKGEAPPLDDDEMDVTEVTETARETFMTSERNPFEPVPDDLMPCELLEQAQAAAAKAAQRLREQNPHGKITFMRQKKDGSTTLAILNPGDGIDAATQERSVSLGSLLPKILPGHGTSRLEILKEDLRNRIKAVKPLNYGPFGSYLPSYDSTFANISKQESELVYQTYGDETGVQYAESILDYVRDCDYALNIVDDLLNLMTGGEHAKVMRILSEKRKSQALSVEEEHILQQVEMYNKVSAKGSTSASKSPVKADAPAEPDFTSLRTLSDVGIDTSFLDSLEKDLGSKRSVQTKLNETGRLLARLEKVQKDRLSGPLPVHLANVQKPSETETQLAEGVTEGISQVAKFVPPESIANMPGVRKAMGIEVHPVKPSLKTDAKSSLDRELEKILGEESIVNNPSTGEVLSEIFS